MAGVKHKNWLFSIKVMYQTNKKGCYGAAFLIGKFPVFRCYFSFLPGNMLLKLSMPVKNSAAFISEQCRHPSQGLPDI